MQDAAAAEDFQAFLGVGFGAVGQIVDRADGAVLETEAYAEAVAGLPGHGGHVVGGDGAPGHVPQQVDEMAALADHAPAAHLGVLGPVVHGDGPGVDGHDHGLGLAHGSQGLAQGHGQGGEAAVEADHEHLLRALVRQGLDLGQLVQGQAQGFFHEHVLAGREALFDHGGVGVVAGGDDHGVHGRVGENALRVRGGRGKTELLAQVGSGDARARRNGRQTRPARLLHGRQQHPARIPARPDHADDRRRRGHGLALDRQGDGAAHVHRVRGIGQDDADIRLRVVRDHAVGFFRVFDGETMGGQRPHVDLAGGHEVEDGLEIALLGPAHVGDGVILRLVLVLRIIAAGAVGAGDLEGQFLLVKDGAGQFEPGHAHQHDAPALAAHGGRLHDRLRGLGGGGDEHPVHAATMAERLRRLEGILPPGQVHGLRTKGPGQLALARVKIDAQHPAAIGGQDLHGQKPDQPQPRDHETLPQGRLRQSDTLQGNGPDNGKGRGLVGHRIRNPGAQIGRNGNHLGMVPIADHPVPNLEPRLQTRPDLGDNAHIAIAQGQGRIELGEDGIDGRHEPVGLDLVDDHLDLVGLLPRLLQVIALAEIDEHALGPGGDQGGGGFYEKLMTGRQGAGFVDQFGCAVFKILEDLFQAKDPY